MTRSWRQTLAVFPGESPFWRAGAFGSAVACAIALLMIMPIPGSLGASAHSPSPLPSSASPASPTPSSSAATPAATTWHESCYHCGPSSRADAGIAYDSVDGYSLLFGGVNSTRVADTWEFHSGSWFLLHPVTSPSARQGGMLVYDPTDHEFVLFGGLDNTLTLLNDTWVFSGGNWTQLVTPHAPAPRYDAGMTWDATDGYVLLFGGCGVSCTGGFADTWKFLGGQWTQLSPLTSPSARGWAPITYDGADHEVLLFGGCGPSYVSLSDTWTYQGGNWAQIFPASRPPARCDQMDLAYDATLGYTTLFGGTDNGTDLADTWEFLGGSWTQIIPNASPDPRTSNGMWDDPTEGGVVIFGGDVGCNSCATNETWVYQSAASVPLAISAFGATPSGVALGQSLSISTSGTGGTPPYTFSYTGLPTGCVNLYTAALSCTPTGRGIFDTRVYLNDSASASVSATIEIQVYQPVFRNWTQICGFCGPSPRQDAGMAFDPTGGYTLLFGGIVGSTRLGDTWEFKGGNWFQLHPTTSPSARQGGTMVWDPVDQELVLFGGVDNTPAVLNDTWVFSGGNWTQLATPHAPAPRYDAGMTWDAADGYVLLFGGCSLACSSGHGDTWKFLGGTWTQLSPVNAPSARGWASLTYDAADHEVLLFGGCAPGYVSLGDTWTFKGGLWTQVFPPLQPSPRCDQQDLAYDPSLGYTVLYGGTDNGTMLGDTWSFLGGVWTPVTTAVFPSARTSNSMVDDPAVGGVIIFGGTVGCNSCEANSTYIFGPWAPSPLSVTLAATPNPADAGSNVSAQAATTGGGGTVSYAFDFGDGTFLSSATGTVNHAFSAAGHYVIAVWANDSAGQSATSSVMVTIDPQLTASLAVNPNPADLGSPVNFTSSVSGGVAPYTYSWSFGDGGLGGNLPNITHIYTTNGPFVAVLTVIDATGAMRQAWASVSIALQVSMSANVTLGAAPLVAGFHSTVAGGVPGYTYAWTFGDGATSAVASPTHTYLSAGTYSARLQVKDSQGHSATSTWNITTTPSGPLTIAVSASPAQIYLGNLTTITASPSGGRGGYTLVWSLLPSWCSAEGLAKLLCLPAVSGTYTFQAQVTDASGSRAVGQATLSVLPNEPSSGNKGPTLGFLGLPGYWGIGLVVLVAIAVVAAALVVAYASRRRESRKMATGSATTRPSPPSTSQEPSGPSSGNRRPPSPPGETDSLRDLF